MILKLLTFFRELICLMSPLKQNDNQNGQWYEGHDCAKSNVCKIRTNSASGRHLEIKLKYKICKSAACTRN